MAKKGKDNKTKRISVPSAIPIRNKKHYTFIVSASPGPHPKNFSIPLAVLLRDELGVCSTQAEAKKIIKQKNVLVDGRVRTNHKFPVGFMDIIFIKKLNKYYRIEIIKGKLKAIEVKKTDVKYCRVTKKLTIKNKKISIGLHDGKTLIGDNNIKVGDTLKISIPEYKIIQLIKLQPGVNCIVYKGKHGGKFGKLEKIIEQRGSMASNVILRDEQNKELITSLNYIMAIDEEFFSKN